MRWTCSKSPKSNSNATSIAISDIALSRPVAVTYNDRGSNVLISAEEYLRLKRRDR